MLFSPLSKPGRQESHLQWLLDHQLRMRSWWVCGGKKTSALHLGDCRFQKLPSDTVFMVVTPSAFQHKHVLITDKGFFFLFLFPWIRTFKNRSSSFCRKIMSTRRPCRLLSTPYLAPHHITSRCGQRLHLHTAMSVRGSCGESHGKACVVLSVVSSAMKSAKNYWMLTVCSVSTKEMFHRSFHQGSETTFLRYREAVSLQFCLKCLRIFSPH